MNAAKKRTLSRLRKKQGIRKHIFGTAECPRLSVFRSLKHIYVQAIDDENGVTIASASSVDKEVKNQIEGTTSNIAAAKTIGKSVAEKLVGKGVTKAVFDRNGILYHGRVKAVADGAREAGLQF